MPGSPREEGIEMEWENELENAAELAEMAHENAMVELEQFGTSAPWFDNGHESVGHWDMPVRVAYELREEFGAEMFELVESM